MLSTKNEKGSSNGLILVVDDNDINRYVASKLLRLWGFEVETAENGQAAVDLVTTRHYDLVLMDIYMPLVDGFEATDMIRAHNNGEYKDLPIVALTASTLDKDLDEIRRSGMSDYILKPFVPEEFKRKISDILVANYSDIEF